MKLCLSSCLAVPVLLLAVAVSACNTPGKPEQGNAGTSAKLTRSPGYDMKRFEKVYNQGKNPGDEESYCRMSYPVFSGSTAAEAINRTVESYIADSTALSPSEGYSGPRTPEALAGKFLKDFETFRQETDMGLPYQFDLKGSVLLNNGNVLTLEMSSYAYTGGAHGMDMTVYLVFDAATGRRLSIADVFASGFDGRLGSLIETRFRQEKGLSPDERLDSEKGGLFENRIGVTPNFALTARGVRFLYNPYEIAPYASGPVEIELLYSELDGLLKPEYRNMLRD
jgi:hypothetical protein